MTEKEHRDVYIAAAVGGVALVLIYLFLNGGSVTPQTVASDTQVPSATATPPPAQTAYNYNIQPFNPGPGLILGDTNIGGPGDSFFTSSYTGGTMTPPPATGGCSGNCGSCKQTCGPVTGNSIANNTVGQFMALMGFGNDAGA